MNEAARQLNEILCLATVVDNKKLTFRTVATIVVRNVYIRTSTVLFRRAPFHASWRKPLHTLYML